MSMQDPISDMFTRIRNALMMSKEEVSVPLTTLKKNIVDVLKNEGYITDFSVTEEEGKEKLRIYLKYYEGQPVIKELYAVSKPSLRIYKRRDEIPVVDSGLGVAVISTSKGVMSDREARKMGLGGEVLCFVS